MHCKLVLWAGQPATGPRERKRAGERNMKLSKTFELYELCNLLLGVLIVKIV